MQSKRFWFLRNWQAWTVLLLGLVTAFVSRQPWVVTLGIIGYLLVLLFEAGLDPRSLVRMLHAEQENRSLREEHRRLVGGISELEARSAELHTEIERLTQELQAAELDLQRAKGETDAGSRVTKI